MVDTFFNRDEVVVSSTLHDLTVLHDDDLVSVTDSAQSVSNDDDRLLSTVDQLVQGLLHLVLGLSIQSGGGLVEQKNLRLADQGTSNGDALLLATGEFDSSLAASSFVYIWEEVKVVNEVVGVSLMASIVDHGFDLRVSLCIKLETISDILANGSSKENGLLLDNSDLLVEPLGVQLLDVTSIEKNLTFDRIVEPLNK